MPDRRCPSCHEPVLAHQTLCPGCRASVPAEAGPVAADSSAFTFSTPPPRQGPDRSAPPSAAAPRPASVPAPVPAAAPAPLAPVPPSVPVPAPPPPPIVPAPLPPPAPAPWPATPPSAGTIGAPGAAVLDERGNLAGGVTGLVAAALVAAGAFLPWMVVEGRDVSGWAASPDAKVLLGLAVVATVVAALVVGGARSLALRLGLAGLGVVIAGLGLFEMVSAVRIDEFDVSLGLGLPLVIGGGAVAVAAGALTRHRRFLPG